MHSVRQCARKGFVTAVAQVSPKILQTLESVNPRQYCRSGISLHCAVTQGLCRKSPAPSWFGNLEQDRSSVGAGFCTVQLLRLLDGLAND